MDLKLKKKKMRILFVYKHEFLDPVGIITLSAFLKKHGHDCQFIDVKFTKDFNKEVMKISPDIIAYSITTGRHKFYQKLNEKLKRTYEVFSIFGGAHTTFFPEFIYENGVDAICRGEGEYPLLELADKLHKEDITNIKNLWVKVKGEVYKNELRPLIEDLDIVPDRELLDKYKKYKNMQNRFVITGRGCPYKCTYCFNHAYNKFYEGKGKVIRKRSVDNVIQELQEIKQKYGKVKIQFMDDIFNIDRQWTFDFCKAYKQIGLPFGVILRANLVNEEIVKALKEAGCIRATISAECGSDHLRNNILKRDISKQQIIIASHLFNKYGLKNLIQNMVGLPDETLKEVYETLSLNIECKPTYSWVSIFQPYPNTELCDYSKERGYFDNDTGSFKESYFDKSIMKMRDIEKMVRLGHLLSLCVAFPKILPLIKILIKLPLDRLYYFIWRLHRLKCYLFDFKYIGIRELF